MADPDFSGLLQRIKWWLVGLAGSLLVRLAFITVKSTSYGLENVAEARRTGRGQIVFAIWHGRLLGNCYANRNWGAAVMNSRHADGEIMSRIVQRLGFISVRGSSTRGAVAALKAMLRTLRSGHDLAFTLDGPKGPPLVAKPGAIYTASRSGCPLVPVSVGYSRCWQFASWDRFQFPRPFCRMAVGYGRPILLPRDLDESSEAQWTARVEKGLNRMADACDNLARPPVLDRRSLAGRLVAGFLRRKSDFGICLPLVVLLLPFELIYRALWGIREITYSIGLAKSSLPAAPVICAGSLFAGGAGKTPLAVELARRLTARGITVAVLLRGYGSHSGRGSVPLVIPAGEVTGPRLAQLARSAGDEPALIARSVPSAAVVVSADRVRSARTATERLGARVLVLDDGFGHRKLARQLDLLLFTPALARSGLHLLPAGYLREPRRAVRRAAALVVIRGGPGEAESEIRRWSAGREIVWLRRRVAGVMRLADWLASPTALSWADPCQTLAGGRLLAFCGIASPESFRETLVSFAPERLDLAAFADHHPYSEADQERLAAAARQRQARLVTTEKDAVKLDPRLVGADCLVLGLFLEEEQPGSLDRLLDKLPVLQEKA